MTIQEFQKMKRFKWHFLAIPITFLGVAATNPYVQIGFVIATIIIASKAYAAEHR